VRRHVTDDDPALYGDNPFEQHNTAHEVWADAGARVWVSAAYGDPAQLVVDGDDSDLMTFATPAEMRRLRRAVVDLADRLERRLEVQADRAAGRLRRDRDVEPGGAGEGLRGERVSRPPAHHTAPHGQYSRPILQRGCGGYVVKLWAAGADSDPIAPMSRPTSGAPRPGRLDSVGCFACRRRSDRLAGVGRL
jgi:hypothetical protein